MPQNIRKKYKKRLFASGKVYCGYCALELNENTFTIDHIIPLCAGGKDRISNYLASCGPCNHQRGKEYIILKRRITGRHKCFQCNNDHHNLPCPFSKEN